jgi:hypothetical protein
VPGRAGGNLLKKGVAGWWFLKKWCTLGARMQKVL